MWPTGDTFLSCELRQLQFQPPALRAFLLENQCHHVPQTSPRRILPEQSGLPNRKAPPRLRSVLVPPLLSKASAGSLAWLIARYRETPAWTSLPLATRRQRENIFRQVIESAGRSPGRCDNGSNDRGWLGPSRQDAIPGTPFSRRHARSIRVGAGSAIRQIQSGSRSQISFAQIGRTCSEQRSDRCGFAQHLWLVRKQDGFALHCKC